MTNEERFIDIEIRIARQEDTVDELNKTIYLQQKKIDKLEALCSVLVQHVKELRETANANTSSSLSESPIIDDRY